MSNNRDRIEMKTPLVEMDGDEMTRIMWGMIKEKLILPFVNLRTVYFDLGLPEREKTKDRVTADAARACSEYGVAVKCATITPNLQRMEEYSLSELWRSPNATIRAALDGTVFRKPIVVKNIKPSVRGWEKPITVARHAFGDLYAATEFRTTGAGFGELYFEGADGSSERKKICDMPGPGIFQAQFNRDSSIESFARSCFEYALGAREDLLFSAKDTISKKYDQTFKLIFARIFEEEYKDQFEKAGITYSYTLIDDAVARVIRSRGGFVWALKNYDGDVMSDMISSAFGSLAMMTSVLLSPDGKYEYEAAHGTVTRHYYRYRAGEKTSTNPVATIFAWSGALRRRGEIDGIERLCRFADALESACTGLIESGVMTGDLCRLADPEPTPMQKDTEEFIDLIAERLSKDDF